MSTIVHVIESDGGSSEFVLSLIKYLPGYRHIILAGERARIAIEKFCIDNAQTYTATFTCIPWDNVQRELRPVQDLKAYKSLHTLLRPYKNDVVHLHSSKAGFIGRLACSALHIRKVLYTTHAVAFLRKDVPTPKVFLYKTLEKLASVLPAEIVCCSKSEQEALASIRIESKYISNGTEVTEYVPYLPKPQFTVVHVGRATIQKNPAQFNRIAEKFIENKNIQFIWVGDGELRNILTSPNVFISGWVSKQQVYSYLQKSDVYLSTALWEGMPLSVLQAMNAGKALILSACIGNKDLVWENKNGITFDTEQQAVDCIRYLLANTQKIEEWGHASWELCKQEFSIENTALQYSQLYANIANNK